MRLVRISEQLANKKLPTIVDNCTRHLAIFYVSRSVVLIFPAKRFFVMFYLLPGLMLYLLKPITSI